MLDMCIQRYDYLYILDNCTVLDPVQDSQYFDSTTSTCSLLEVATVMSTIQCPSLPPFHLFTKFLTLVMRPAQEHCSSVVNGGTAGLKLCGYELIGIVQVLDYDMACG